ncbi:MAG: LemA family protein [Clostridiales bacterium]|nr:LemA family protein [Clostridiales bacterium]
MFLLGLKTSTIVTIVVIAAVLLLIIIIGAWIGMRNTLVRLEASCDEAWSSIDIYLKKRYDLIPNLVETVKGYTKHEGETLERVIAARNAAVVAKSPNEKIAADNALSGTLRQLYSLKENYPDLKASSQFVSLQKQLQEIESELAQARKFYNGKCKAFNTKLRTFPSNLVAGGMHLEKRNYFELDSELERQNVKVSF